MNQRVKNTTGSPPCQTAEGLTEGINRKNENVKYSQNFLWDHNTDTWRTERRMRQELRDIQIIVSSSGREIARLFTVSYLGEPGTSADDASLDLLTPCRCRKKNFHPVSMPLILHSIMLQCLHASMPSSLNASSSLALGVNCDPATNPKTVGSPVVKVLDIFFTASPVFLSSKTPRPITKALGCQKRSRLGKYRENNS